MSWFRCAHRFGFPMTLLDRDGRPQTVQRCTECGKGWLYCWKTMRRTERIDERGVQHVAPRRKSTQV